MHICVVQCISEILAELGITECHGMKKDSHGSVDPHININTDKMTINDYQWKETKDTKISTPS